MISRGIVSCIALLLAMPSIAGNQTRISAFEYDPVTGQLTKEIIEPLRQGSDPDSANAGNYYQFCLVTTYVYDSYGNRTSATTRNCNGSSSNEAPAPTGDPVFTSRTSTSAFDAGSITIGGIIYTWNAGQFATSSGNALGHSEAREFDPRFGGVTRLTGPNGIATNWTYDGFGRKSTETRADTTVTSWFYERCVDLAGACPQFGQYRARVTATGSPTTSTYYDSLNHELRTESQGFDGSTIRKDTQYDSFSRVSFVSRPYKVGDAVYWTAFGYDLLGRVRQVDEPTVNGASARTVTDYNGLQTTVTVSNAGTTTKMPAQVTQTTVTTKNSQGQVVQVTRQ